MVLDRSRQKHNCLLCCYSSLRQTRCRPNLYITKRGSVQNINNIRKNRPLTSPDVLWIEPERLMGQFHVSLSLSNRCRKTELLSHTSGLHFICVAASLGCIKSPFQDFAGPYRAIQRAVAEHHTHPGQTICKQQRSTSPEGSPGIGGYGQCQLTPIISATFLLEGGLRRPRSQRICRVPQS